MINKRTNVLSQKGYVATKSSAQAEAYVEEEIAVASPVAEYLTRDKLLGLIEQVREQMYAAAKELNFVETVRLHGEIYTPQSRLENQKK